ncbi:MAG: transglutaminase family protein [Bacteroidales bacterium]|nr:transglutaminase-like domain-containing protein [Bacteroidales bacterium]MDD2424652.1 transglutaminase family protein [Bacteroidales bacterium]MDD3989128.1 transglutaminase family protein [Bacteroidales bacterium]
MTGIQEIRSIVQLMSDNDPVVWEAVSGKILSMSQEEIGLMRIIINSEFSPAELKILNKILEEGDAGQTEKDLNKYLKEEDPPLSEGVFLVTKLADNSCEKTVFYENLSHLSSEISEEMSDNMTDVERVELFNHILFKRVGFKYSPAGSKPELENTLVNRVFELRRANYISIALVYLMIAREVGLQVYPLWVQKGFFPVYLGPGNKMLFYLNMAYNFEILTREAVASFIKEIENTYGRDAIVVEKDSLLLTIYVQILTDIFSRSGDHKKASVMQRILDEMGGRKIFGDY